MRLRATIRAPSRYEDECELSTGVSPRRLPRRRKAAAAAEEERRIPYVDFIPNQPPAAFPTLDHPLPAGQGPPSSTQPEHNLVTTTSTSSAAADTATVTDNTDPEADGHHLDAFNSYYRDIPQADLDSFIASNGPQNPQYRRNMALLAREDSSDLEISDDDDGEQRWVHREEPIPDDPQWHDIPLSLQIEIAENMLETHRLSTIQLLLGLNQCDLERLTRNLEKQNEDLEYENRVLEEMRDKQLKALMCLDNSDLKQHSVPARLVMSRKSWDRCHRVIRKHSKMRYLLCQAGDLLLARKFLSKRGLPMVYAGEWHNQYVATPAIFNTTGALETLEWKGAAQPPSDPSTAAGNGGLSGNPPQSSIAGKTNVQNLSPDALSNTQQTPGSRHAELVLPNQSIVRLKIGPKNAARIHVEQLTQPSTPPRRYMGPSGSHFTSSRSRSTAREPNSDDTIEQSPSEMNRFDGLHNQYPMPVLRKLGSWSTDVSRLQTSESRFSTRPLPGSFNNNMHRSQSAVQPTARQSDQANRVNTHNRPTLDTEHSFNSSPPQSSDFSPMEGIVYESARDLTVRNAIQTPTGSSPNCTTTSNLTVCNRVGRLTTNVERYLATPESYRTVARDMQSQSSVSAYQRSSLAPSDDAEFGNLGFASPFNSKSDDIVEHTELKRKQRAAQADTDALAASAAMQGLNLFPSESLNSIQTAKGYTAEASTVIADPSNPVADSKGTPDEGRQETTNPLPTEQQRKPIKYTNPIFGFDSFEVHADSQVSQDANISQADRCISATDQEQPRADTIGTSTGESFVLADIPIIEVEGMPACTNGPQNANANQEAVKDVPPAHLTPISGNAAVEMPPSTRKTRLSVKKEQLTSAKRDSGVEMREAQPRRNKNADSTTNPPERVTRGRGRPRKNKNWLIFCLSLFHIQMIERRVRVNDS